MKNAEKPKPDLTVDASGQLCPMPIIMLTKAANDMAPGQVVEIIADDKGFVKDLPLWCKSSGNKFISLEETDGKYRGLIRKQDD